MKRMMEWLLAVVVGICLALAAQVLGVVNLAPAVYVRPTTLTLTDGDGMKEERFIVVFLDARNRVTGSQIVSIGSLNASIVPPREVFRAAILHGAAAIILGHNHPSGDPTPSSDDMELTRRLVKSGELLGIGVLDHVIIGDTSISLKEKGLL